MVETMFQICCQRQSGYPGHRRLYFAIGEEPTEGLLEFLAPIFQVVAAVIFMVMDGGAKGLQSGMGVLHSDDLRNFGRVVDFGFLVADAEPKAVGNGRVLGGDFGEAFVVPPKGAGLGQAVRKMARQARRTRGRSN
jgi:hypothetical protein